LNKDFGLESANTYPIFKSSSGNIWIGQNPGFFKIEKNKIVPWNKLYWEGPPVTWAITEDTDKNIWVACNGGGLHRIGKKGRENLSPLIEKGAGLLFFSAYKDSKNRLWFGSLGHITKYENGKFTFYTPFGNYRNIYRQILEDDAGTLWFGSDLGLVKYEGGNFVMLDSLKAQSARALYVDSKKRLWIGTYGNGIRIKVRDKFYSLRYKDGLFSDIVSSIVEDFRGNFWFTCNNGIFRIKEKDIDAFLNGKSDNVNSLSYGNEEGLENIEFNGGCQPSWMRDGDGNLWFPSFSGPVVVDINSINSPKNKFTVLIENLTYKDSVFLPGDKIVLPADYTNFTINLIAPSYASSKNMRFKYRLLGSSEEWIDIGKKREVFFQKLPYGKYEFQVIASDSYGNWAVTPATISFAVDSIFWETPLFFALISLVIILTMVFFFNLKLRLATDQQTKLEKVIAERTQSLVEAKEKAELSASEEKKLRSKAEEENRQKIELLRIVSHDLKNPVFAVQGFADMLLEDGELNNTDKGVALMIQEAGEQLKELITQLLAFSRFEGGQFNVDKSILNVGSQISKIVDRLRNQAVKKKQKLHTDLSSEEIKISADQVLFEQIFENLISNAIKYSPAEKDIFVSMKETDGKVSLSVKDHGQGFSEADKANLYKPFVKLSSLPTGGESSSGLGLTIVKKFVEINDGTITLISEKNAGAEFIVVFNTVK
jgi:signal transduction histidine kinase/streptogramin lyase